MMHLFESAHPTANRRFAEWMQRSGDSAISSYLAPDEHQFVRRLSLGGPFPHR